MVIVFYLKRETPIGKKQMYKQQMTDFYINYQQKSINLISSKVATQSMPKNFKDSL
jgi:hypothetical protein